MIVILFKTISTRIGPSWMASETDALSLCRGIILALSSNLGLLNSLDLVSSL